LDYIKITINQITKTVTGLLQDQKGIHAETAIATLSAVIGKQLVHEVLTENKDPKADLKLLLGKQGRIVLQTLLNSPTGQSINTEKLYDNIPDTHKPNPSKVSLIIPL
jgi:hypothetical protein